MRATGPTAWAALSGHKFCKYPLDMILSSLRFFNAGSPANPLIACQWRKVFPLL